MRRDGDSAPHANRLAGETSPYLLQHARNPVDWYPWGSEALERARELDRPIFLSIGYAACHWCHVMERESFEDETTAAELNEGFVAIKVDREERPDLDQLYMGAVQAMTGQGGWPMSVFLSPDGRPFYAGTYFPGTPHSGMPSFRQVLDGVRRAWTEQRAEVEATGAHVVEAMLAGRTGPRGATMPDRSTLEQAVATLETAFDAAHGGWGGAPKFPAPMTIELLLRHHVVTRDPRPLAMALRTLDAMSAGGIHDQLGGGFHRYSTDAIWLVPHFEQMLYDNAQLARVYLHAWALTGSPAYLETATGTLDFVLRDLQTPGGGFASSLDADTGGIEGATFTWTAAEIREALGDGADLFSAAYGVTERGNWEDRTILSRVRDDRRLAEQFGLLAPDVVERLAAAKAVLLARRSGRAQPARDDKALAAWNGLAIAALAEAARAMAAGGDPALTSRATAYRAAAERAATDVLDGLGRPDGRLRRSWKDGRATADGVLEDHADLADGLLALYEATFDERWFTAALALTETILVHFADPAGGFFDTPDDGEALIVRPKDEQDNATPSGGAMAATVLLRLAALTGEGRYRSAAEAALAGVGPYLGRYPGAFAQWLSVLEVAQARLTEIAIIGDPAASAARRLLEVASRGYRPFRVLAASPQPEISAVPLLHGRFALRGRTTAFVCQDFACRQPVTEPEALEALLEAR